MIPFAAAPGATIPLTARQLQAKFQKEQEAARERARARQALQHQQRQRQQQAEEEEEEEQQRQHQQHQQQQDLTASHSSSVPSSVFARQPQTRLDDAQSLVAAVQRLPGGRFWREKSLSAAAASGGRPVAMYDSSSGVHAWSGLFGGDIVLTSSSDDEDFERKDEEQVEEAGDKEVPAITGEAGSNSAHSLQSVVAHIGSKDPSYPTEDQCMYDKGEDRVKGESESESESEDESEIDSDIDVATALRTVYTLDLRQVSTSCTTDDVFPLRLLHALSNLPFSQEPGRANRSARRGSAKTRPVSSTGPLRARRRVSVGQSLHVLQTIRSTCGSVADVPQHEESALQERSMMKSTQCLLSDPDPLDASALFERDVELLVRGLNAMEVESGSRNAIALFKRLLQSSALQSVAAGGASTIDLDLLRTWTNNDRSELDFSSLTATSATVVLKTLRFAALRNLALALASQKAGSRSPNLTSPTASRAVSADFCTVQMFARFEDVCEYLAQSDEWSSANTLAIAAVEKTFAADEMREAFLQLPSVILIAETVRKRAVASSRQNEKYAVLPNKRTAPEMHIDHAPALRKRRLSSSGFDDQANAMDVALRALRMNRSDLTLWHVAIRAAVSSGDLGGARRMCEAAIDSLCSPTRPRFPVPRSSAFESSYTSRNMPPNLAPAYLNVSHVSPPRLEVRAPTFDHPQFVAPYRGIEDVVFRHSSLFELLATISYATGDYAGCERVLSIQPRHSADTKRLAHNLDVLVGRSTEVGTGLYACPAELLRRRVLLKYSDSVNAGAETYPAPLIVRIVERCTVLSICQAWLAAWDDSKHDDNAPLFLLAAFSECESDVSGLSTATVDRDADVKLEAVSSDAAALSNSVSTFDENSAGEENRIEQCRAIDSEDSFHLRKDTPSIDIEIQHNTQPGSVARVAASISARLPADNDSVTGSTIDSQEAKATTRLASNGRIQRNADATPVLPFKDAKTGSAEIQCLGRIEHQRPKFYDRNYIWPIGFKSTRIEKSIRDSTKTAIYTTEILDGGDGPIFRITPSDDPSQMVEASVSSRAWAEMLSKIRHKPIVSISGPQMIGLACEEVKRLIQELPNADKCKGYIWRDSPEESGDAITEASKSTDSPPGTRRRTRQDDRDPQSSNNLDVLDAAESERVASAKSRWHGYIDEKLSLLHLAACHQEELAVQDDDHKGFPPQPTANHDDSDEVVRALVKALMPRDDSATIRYVRNQIIELLSTGFVHEDKHPWKMIWTLETNQAELSRLVRDILEIHGQQAGFLCCPKALDVSSDTKREVCSGISHLFVAELYCDVAYASGPEEQTQLLRRCADALASFFRCASVPIFSSSWNVLTANLPQVELLMRARWVQVHSTLLAAQLRASVTDHSLVACCRAWLTECLRALGVWKTLFGPPAVSLNLPHLSFSGMNAITTDRCSELEQHLLEIGSLQDGDTAMRAGDFVRAVSSLRFLVDSKKWAVSAHKHDFVFESTSVSQELDARLAGLVNLINASFQQSILGPGNVRHCVDDSWALIIQASALTLSIIREKGLWRMRASCVFEATNALVRVLFAIPISIIEQLQTRLLPLITDAIALLRSFLREVVEPLLLRELLTDAANALKPDDVDSLFTLTSTPTNAGSGVRPHEAAACVVVLAQMVCAVSEVVGVCRSNDEQLARLSSCSVTHLCHEVLAEFGLCCGGSSWHAHSRYADGRFEVDRPWAVFQMDQCLRAMHCFTEETATDGTFSAQYGDAADFMSLALSCCFGIGTDDSHIALMQIPERNRDKALSLSRVVAGDSIPNAVVVASAAVYLFLHTIVPKRLSESLIITLPYARSKQQIEPVDVVRAGARSKSSVQSVIEQLFNANRTMPADIVGTRSTAFRALSEVLSVLPDSANIRTRLKPLLDLFTTDAASIEQRDLGVWLGLFMLAARRDPDTGTLTELDAQGYDRHRVYKETIGPPFKGKKPPMWDDPDMKVELVRKWGQRCRILHQIFLMATQTGDRVLTAWCASKLGGCYRIALGRILDSGSTEEEMFRPELEAAFPGYINLQLYDTASSVFLRAEAFLQIAIEVEVEVGNYNAHDAFAVGVVYDMQRRVQRMRFLQAPPELDTELLSSSWLTEASVIAFEACLRHARDADPVLGREGADRWLCLLFLGEQRQRLLHALDANIQTHKYREIAHKALNNFADAIAAVELVHDRMRKGLPRFRELVVEPFYHMHALRARILNDCRSLPDAIRHEIVHDVRLFMFLDTLGSIGDTALEIDPTMAIMRCKKDAPYSCRSALSSSTTASNTTANAFGAANELAADSSNTVVWSSTGNDDARSWTKLDDVEKEFEETIRVLEENFASPSCYLGIPQVAKLALEQRRSCQTFMLFPKFVTCPCEHMPRSTCILCGHGHAGSDITPGQDAELHALTRAIVAVSVVRPYFAKNLSETSSKAYWRRISDYGGRVADSVRKSALLLAIATRAQWLALLAVLVRFEEERQTVADDNTPDVWTFLESVRGGIFLPASIVETKGLAKSLEDGKLNTFGVSRPCITVANEAAAFADAVKWKLLWLEYCSPGKTEEQTRSTKTAPSVEWSVQPDVDGVEHAGRVSARIFQNGQARHSTFLNRDLRDISSLRITGSGPGGKNRLRRTEDFVESASDQVFSSQSHHLDVLRRLALLFALTSQSGTHLPPRVARIIVHSMDMPPCSPLDMATVDAVRILRWHEWQSKPSFSLASLQRFDLRSVLAWMRDRRPQHDIFLKRAEEKLPNCDDSQTRTTSRTESSGQTDVDAIMRDAA